MDLAFRDLLGLGVVVVEEVEVDVDDLEAELDVDLEASNAPLRLLEEGNGELTGVPSLLLLEEEQGDTSRVLELVLVMSMPGLASLLVVLLRRRNSVRLHMMICYDKIRKNLGFSPYFISGCVEDGYDRS